MNKIDQLFIRACKSLNPDIRLRSVYRRFYGNYEHHDIHIANVLISLNEKYDIVSAKICMLELSPDNFIMFGCTIDDDYYLIVKKMLTSKIRLSSIKKFPGMKTPLKFKN